ncbi:DUF3800 domain-containing protein [Tepidimicrobium xylanilyticum]
MGWRNRPKYIDYCPDDVDYIMFIDENGDPSLKYIKKCIEKNQTIDKSSIYFTVTGVIIKKDNLKEIKDRIMEIKYNYWEDGRYKYNNTYKRICFHSREIRRREKPFSDDIINRKEFLNELSNFLDYVPCKIISSTINKEKHFKTYDNPDHPYNLSLNFVLERFVKFYLRSWETALIILEARGKDDDRRILEHIKNVIDFGTRYVSSDDFKKIKGVYFNDKWQPDSNGEKSYFGLEIADLYSYPIHKYCRTRQKDMAFEVLEKKLYRYPYYDGCGLKIFPK